MSSPAACVLRLAGVTSCNGSGLCATRSPGLPGPVPCPPTDHAGSPGSGHSILPSDWKQTQWLPPHPPYPQPCGSSPEHPPLLGFLCRRSLWFSVVRLSWGPSPVPLSPAISPLPGSWSHLTHLCQNTGLWWFHSMVQSPTPAPHSWVKISLPLLWGRGLLWPLPSLWSTFVAASQLFPPGPHSDRGLARHSPRGLNPPSARHCGPGLVVHLFTDRPWCSLVFTRAGSSSCNRPSTAGKA